MALKAAERVRFDCNGCGWAFSSKWELFLHRIRTRGRW